MKATLPLRSDFLASFCVVEENEVADDLPKLVALAAEVERRFKYWEVVYVAGESARGDLKAASGEIAKIRNLRVVLVSDEISYYRRRVVCASEAIGDAVVISSFDELGAADLPAFAARAFETGEIAMARRARATIIFPLFYALLTAASTYRVSSRDLKTIAMPRAKLNALLARPTATLDLRFESKRGGETYRRVAVDVGRPRHRRSAIAERYELAAELIVNSAPRFLKAYAALSMVVVFAAMLYAAYAVAVLFFVATVQEGWFSTAIVQSGSVGFVAGGVALLCLGVAELYERVQGRSRYAIVEEIANISFFDETHDINVEVATLTGEDLPR